MGYEVLAIDIDEKRVQKNKDFCTHVVQADATDEQTLRALGVANFEVAIVSIGHDMQASILVALLLKDLGIPRVIAKASSDVHGKVLKRIGVDRVIFPERDMAIKLANHLAIDNIIDYLEITPDVSIVEVSATPEIQGQTLRELDIRAKYDVNIVALRRGVTEVLVPPGPDEVIRPGDILIALATNENVRRWQEATRSSRGNR